MTSSDRYDQGYEDATCHYRTQVANALRLRGVSTGEAEEELLSDRMIREIFASVFGMVALDQEFGPEPSGKGVRSKLRLA